MRYSQPMILGALRQPDQSTLGLVTLAFLAGLGAFSMMRPSPPREVPAVTRSALVGAAIATLPGQEYDDARTADTGAWDEFEDVEQVGAWDDEPPAPRRARASVDGPPPDLALIGTSVSADPELHRAMLRRPDRAVAGIYHEGDRIDGHVVETIARREVVLRSRGGDRTTYRLSFYTDGAPEPETVEEPTRRRYDEPPDDVEPSDDYDPIDDDF